VGRRAATRTAEVLAIDTGLLARRPTGHRPRPTRLTHRQQEVARLVARGLSNRQIASELVLTAGTVANHVRAILLRTGFHSRAQVAAWLGMPGGVEIGGTPGATAVFDADGSFLKVNAAMAELLGYEQSCLESSGLADVAADGPSVAGELLCRLSADRTWRGEIRLRRADGCAVPVELIARALDTTAGTLNVVSVHDLSHRREVERRQREFVVMLGHELRTPLTAIRGYAQLMQRRGEADAASLDVILHYTRRLERLTNDLLDLTRQDVGLLRLRPETVDLTRLAEAAAEHAQVMSPAHLIRVLAPCEPVLGEWDRGRVEQVLENLLSNAIRYSPDGGTVTVRVATRGPEAELSVDDEGVGIPPEALPNVFDRFYRIERPGSPVVEGLGLGLAVARAIVEAHGGRITACSVPGRGSTFSVRLPYQPPG
jgi:PAS domain S-box-containing protein